MDHHRNWRSSKREHRSISRRKSQRKSFTTTTSATMDIANTSSTGNTTHTDNDQQQRHVEEGLPNQSPHTSPVKHEDSQNGSPKKRRDSRRIGLVAAFLLMVIGAVLVAVSLVQTKDENISPRSAGNDDSDNGSTTSASMSWLSLNDEARPQATTKQARQSSSTFISIQLQQESTSTDEEDDNGTRTVPEVIENTQCAMTPEGWTVSAVEEADAASYPAVNRIHPTWQGSDDVQFGLEHSGFNRTFAVEPNHRVLEDGGGVIFNVETVETALPEDLQKPRLSQEALLNSVQREAGLFYQTQSTAAPARHPPNVTLEVSSDLTANNMVFAGGQGFVAAAMLAFAHHLPLALNPDHLWAVITSGFAHHVDQYPEQLRHHFVNHTGKVDIEIKEDRLLMEQTPPDQWESLVFPRFTEEVERHMNNTEVYELLVKSNFSTTTPTAQAASQITLMAAFKAYFRYTVMTYCGIPKIKLEGTREDWQALYDRTEQLGKWMLTNHPQGELWIKDVVLPILEEFLKAYDGEVNYCFWQNMVKFRESQMRSNEFDFLSGWLPNLFPYLDIGNGSIEANRFLRHWSKSALGDQLGPDPSQIPIQMASAPVMWDYYGQDYPLHFHAGFRGVHQLDGDENGGMLRPVLGWYITHDPQGL